MDRDRSALDQLIPLLDDQVFERYAGLFNAQGLKRPVSPREEIDLMRQVLEKEYERTGDWKISHLLSKLDLYLA